jgi:hypothetical protein
MAQRQESKQETVSIDSTGDLLTVEVEGDVLVSLDIDGDAAADYALDLGSTTDTTVNTAADTYSGSEIHDSFHVGDRYLTVRCTSAAGANDEATITIQEAR